mgnify:CR=1 FL=1
MAKESDDTVTFVFSVSPDHKTVFSNRIWGGLTIGNNIEINFLKEYKPLPKSVTEAIDEVTGGGKEVNREQEKEIKRENQATVYMSLETFLSLKNWIDNKIKEFESAGIISKRPEE